MTSTSVGAPGRSCVLLVLMATLTACGGSSSPGGGTPPPPPAAEFLYASGTNQVMSFSVNTSTGALAQTAVVIEPDNTVGVAASPTGAFLYVSDKGTGIDGFSMGQNGALSPINGSPWPGSPNYYGGGLAMDPGGRFIYAASAAGPPGLVAGFTINQTTGALTAISGSPFSVGIAPVQAVVDKSGSFLYVADMLDAQGSIFGYSIDPSTGALTQLLGSPFPTLPNGQPSGLVADPSGKFLYAPLFTLNSVAAFTIDSSTGALTSVAGSPFVTGADPSSFFDSIAVDPTGKFLFGLSGASSGSVISAFTIGSDGTLTPVSGSPFAAVPSDISGGLAVDPSGKFLYVAGGNAAFILGLSIDGTTGAVTPLASPVSLGTDFPTDLTVAIAQ
jgi:6-phosphogluconolactonase